MHKLQSICHFIYIVLWTCIWNAINCWPLGGLLLKYRGIQISPGDQVQNYALKNESLAQLCRKLAILQRAASSTWLCFSLVILGNWFLGYPQHICMILQSQAPYNCGNLICNSKVIFETNLEAQDFPSYWFTRNNVKHRYSCLDMAAWCISQPPNQGFPSFLELQPTSPVL